VHDDTRNCADEQQEARSRLDEEPGQALLHSFPVAGEVHNAAADPDKTKCRGGETWVEIAP
jgi:hypothetical protein